MRILIVLFLLLNCGHLFAQKHKKSKKENVFAHSYQLDAKDFKHWFWYEVTVRELNADSVIINSTSDSTNLTATISYEYNLISGITSSPGGNFQIKIARSELQNTTLNLTIEFDGYEETLIRAELAEFPDEFSVPIQAYTIFDEETPYIIINSVYPLSVEEQKALVKCMAANKSDKQSCYDEKLIRLTIPI